MAALPQEEAGAGGGRRIGPRLEALAAIFWSYSKGYARRRRRSKIAFPSDSELAAQIINMTRTRALLGCTILAACLAAPGSLAFAQSGGLLGDLFNNNRGSQAQQTQSAQQQAPTIAPQGGSVEARISSIENALRQLTGQIEVLQHQNQMLQMQLKRMQDDTEYRFQQLGTGRGEARPGQRSEALPPAQNPAAPSNQTASAGQGDAFNPALHPNAPGAPRTLGAPGQPMNQAANDQPVGAPGGRDAGAPLDLSSLAAVQSGAAADAQPGDPAATHGPSGQLPPPPQRNPSSTGTQLATLPPSAAPRDEYELAYGYVLHKDYGLAAQAFRDFLRKHPKDGLTPAAHYWLGESLYQQQNYDEAARSFLTVTTQYGKFSKAPDALLRLGQSLAAINQKEAACATLREVTNKFPNASSSVKRGVARELKRVHC